MHGHNGDSIHTFWKRSFFFLSLIIPKFQKSGEVRNTFFFGIEQDFKKTPYKALRSWTAFGNAPACYYFQNGVIGGKQTTSIIERGKKFCPYFGKILAEL